MDLGVMSGSKPVSQRKKSFDEELDELKLQLSKLQANRSRKGRLGDKQMKYGILSQESSESQHSMLRSPSPTIDTNWLREQRGTPSPCSKANLEIIRMKSSESISKKRQIKDALQKRLSDLFASSLKESRSGSTFNLEDQYMKQSLNSKDDGNHTIHDIPTLSSEETISTSHRNLMRSGSLSVEIFNQISSDSSIQEGQLISTKTLPLQEFTNSRSINMEVNAYHPNESSRQTIKTGSCHFNSPLTMKENVNYPMKSHFSMEEITVSGNFFSFKIH